MTDELMTAAQAATLNQLAQDAYELDAFKPNLTRPEADKALVRQTHSLVFGAFGGLWFALLLPLRPFSLLLQRRLSPLLQRPLSLLLQMSTTTAPTTRLGLACPNSV
jgi:hypothetical protein